MIKRLIFDIDGTLIAGINLDKTITHSLSSYGIYSEDNKQKTELITDGSNDFKFSHSKNEIDN